MNLLTILVFIISNYFYIIMFRTSNVNGKEINIAMKNESMDIECKIDSSISKCESTHPSEKKHSSAGSDLRSDNCKVAIRVTKKGEGIWPCYIGSNDTGIKNVNNTLVRVADKVAAIQKNILVYEGTSVTLECTIIKGPKPMRYCRFDPPDNMAYNNNSNVNRDSLLKSRFYYPSNKSLDRGDCAVTIHGVSSADRGLWTCGAGLDDRIIDIDYIKLDVLGKTDTTLLISIGNIVGLAALCMFGMFAYMFGKAWCTVHPQVEEPMHEMQPMNEMQPEDEIQPERRLFLQQGPGVANQSPSP